MGHITLTANQAPDGNYWTTYYNGTQGYQIADESACAYTATYSVSGNEGTLTLNKLGKVIPAGTAVIIVGDDNNISMTASSPASPRTPASISTMEINM